MIVASSQSEDFDPIIWMVEEKGLDLDALRDDPDYAQKLADAHSSYLEKKSKSEEMERQVAENMPASVEAIKKKASEMGLTDEQAAEVVGEMYRVMDDLVVGIISPEIFELLAKGKNYDTAVKDAHDVGVAEGLDKKVDDKLRTLPTGTERVGGRQATVTPKREVEVNNPFI
jgi:hypothetical protein